MVLNSQLFACACVASIRRQRYDIRNRNCGKLSLKKKLAAVIYRYSRTNSGHRIVDAVSNVKSGGLYCNGRGVKQVICFGNFIDCLE